MELYNFQENIITGTKFAMINKHRNVIVQSPTGSGKTVMFSSIVKSADKKGSRCLILTDRIELLEGSEGTLENFGIDTIKILAGAKYPPQVLDHTIAMSQTLRRRINNPLWKAFFSAFSIIIIDEAHIQEFNIYFEKKVFNPNAFIFGFTATPKRSKKQRQLREDYTELVHGPQVQDLISMGFLVPDKYYAPRHFDTSDIKLNSFGDFKESDMFKKIEEKISYTSVISNWEKLANDTITIVFCVNIEHVIKTCIKFNEMGHKAKFLVSSISKPKFDINCTDEQFVRYQQKSALYELYKDNMVKYSGNRQDIIQEWKDGKFKILINAGILTKGFDHKPIETVVVYRATTSETLWLQMLGRGSRISNGKTHFNILDFGSNAEKLGLYAQDREWTLNGSYSNAEGVAPVKECGLMRGVKKKDKNDKEGCGCLILASRKICNYCGYIFEIEKTEIDIDLVHIDYAENSFASYGDVNFTEIERMREERGYRFGWVMNRIISEGGLDALSAYAKYKEYEYGWLNRAQKQYAKIINEYNKKNTVKIEAENTLF